jgi:Uma2 family endonuclease
MSGVSVSTDTRLITGEELALMPDVGPCELADGRIVPMPPTSPEHGRSENNASRIIDQFARTNRLGKVLVGEVGIYTRRDPDTVRGADVLFISNERWARRTTARAFLDVAPDLVVEILSPRDTVMDLAEKLREYFAIGVRLVWVLDPRARRVYAFRASTDVREFRETDRLPGDDVLPGFETSVAALFEE